MIENKAQDMKILKSGCYCKKCDHFFKDTWDMECYCHGEEWYEASKVILMLEKVFNNDREKK